MKASTDAHAGSYKKPNTQHPRQIQRLADEDVKPNASVHQGIYFSYVWRNTLDVNTMHIYFYTTNNTILWGKCKRIYMTI